MWSWKWRYAGSIQHLPFGKPSSSVITAQTDHLLAVSISTTYKYTTKGRVQICPKIATRLNSPITSETYVRTSIVIQEIAVLGMVKRLVTKVPNPMLFKVRVRYCFGVVMGVSNVSPMI
jgi:hypothetical protein